MIINRMREHFPDPEEHGPEDDFFVVACRFQDFFVTREAAMQVVDAVGAREPARWIRFRDLHGSEVVVRTCLIDHVQECTGEQRASWRAFRRARRLEEAADRRPWEDED